MAEPEDVSLNVNMKTRQVILDALDVAADYRRDRIETCAECRDGTCSDCTWRSQTIAECERATEMIAAAPQPEPAPEHTQREASQ